MARERSRRPAFTVEKVISTQEQAQQTGTKSGVTQPNDCEITFGYEISGTHVTNSDEPPPDHVDELIRTFRISGCWKHEFA
jgi:hypothetical protein